uniref:(northern house mosquito) hypothetical protein n=1 Tax=Culex pipiens TaxID=7175 RepID=A0A8D8A6P1_CULPI
MLPEEEIILHSSFASLFCFQNDGFAEGNGELFFKHEPNLFRARIAHNLRQNPVSPLDDAHQPAADRDDRPRFERVPAALLASRYLVTQQTNNGSAKKDLDGPIEPVVIKPAVKRPEMNDVCQWMMTAGRMGGRCPFRRTRTGSS